MKFEIKARAHLDGQVLFTADIPDDTELKFQVRAALTIAVKGGAYLRGAYLRGAYLRDADLRGAYLRDADLRGADLRGADLRGAYLSDADLRGAYLSDADLRGADLRGAYLRDAYLRGAYLRDADLRGTYLSDADLRGADLRGAYLRDADLRGADLSGAYLSDENGEVIKRATPEESIANLDKVREIVLDNEERLKMSVWHEAKGWENRTCAEEAVCGTSHCLAGWLQVCSTDKTLRAIDPQLAGIYMAPVASKMFFRDSDEVLPWLRDRKYAEEAKDYA